MKKVCTTLVGLLLLGSCQTAVSVSNAAENQKTETGKGMTVDDLVRGLKSAEQNVEKEIPKIGPAIGETFKKMTEKSANKPPQETPKDKKERLRGPPRFVFAMADLSPDSTNSSRSAPRRRCCNSEERGRNRSATKATTFLMARQTPQPYPEKRMGRAVIESETWCRFLPDFRQQCDLDEHPRRP